MKHFVGYHNFEAMEAASEEEAAIDEVESAQTGDDEEAPESGVDGGRPFGFVTRKKSDRFIGNVIWGVQGQGKPREYYLFDWFIVDTANQLEGERFSAQLRGMKGIRIPDGIYLNDLDWFPEFRKANSNFSLGIQEIAPKFIRHFCELVKTRDLPLPPGCDELLQAPTPPRDQTGSTPDTPAHPQEAETTTERRAVTTDRIIRDTAITKEVKRLHGCRCEVCGCRLETPKGPYAEGAHIRPLGSPHEGPDTLDNVLCLCPNHHTLFDFGAVSIGDDFRLVGMEGTLRVESSHPLSLEHIRYHRERIYQTQ